MPTQFFTARRRGAWHFCSAFKIQLQKLYYSSHHYPHGTHFSNFIGFLSNGRYSLSWLPLPTVLHIGTPVICDWTPPSLHSHTLRSFSSANLYVPRTKLHFDSRSFHIASPTVWNSLPSTLHSSQTLNTFRKHLKTHVYQSAFNSPQWLVQHLLIYPTKWLSWLIKVYYLLNYTTLHYICKAI